VYLLVFHAYINEMHGSRSEIPSKNVYDVKFLALLGAPYIYDISRLGVIRRKVSTWLCFVVLLADALCSLCHAAQRSGPPGRG
jgi:hypothetical protein